MCKEFDGAYVVSCAMVSVTLVFDYIAMRLRGCGGHSARNIIIIWSFWAEEINVLSGF